MTSLREGTTPADLRLSTRSLRRRASVIASVLVAVVLIAAALVTWQLTAASARAGVVVLTDERSLTCSPASAATRTPAEVGSGGSSTVLVPAIRLDGPTTCTLTFVIADDGSRPVTVDAIHLAPLLPINGLHTGDVGETGATGAPFELAAGEAQTIRIGLSWQHGCLAYNGIDHDADTPTLTLTAEGLRGTVSRPGPAYAVIGSRHSESACPWRK